MTTYTLTVNEETLKVIMAATHSYARLMNWQVNYAIEDLPLKKNAILDWRDVQAIEGILEPYRPSYDEKASHNKTKDLSWGVYSTIRHKLSWKDAIERGYIKDMNSERNWKEMMGVNYDPPFDRGLGLPVLSEGQ